MLGYTTVKYAVRGKPYYTAYRETLLINQELKGIAEDRLSKDTVVVVLDTVFIEFSKFGKQEDVI